MRPAYIRVDLGDPADNAPSSFAISTVPFVYHAEEHVMPADAKMYGAESYSGLCAILKYEFQIPAAMLSTAKYFKPTRRELEQGMSTIYRTVPEGMGEPEWKTKARNAILCELEESDCFTEKGRVSVNDKHCYSLEELREELEIVAERAGGKKRISDEAYQPDYDTLVKEVLQGYSSVMDHIGLPKRRKRAR